MHIDAPSSSADREPTYAEPAGTPSAEAMFAVRVAGEIARQLHESGRDLRFSLGPAPGRVEVLLCDADGSILSRLAAAHALEIASGAPLAAGSR